MRARRASSVSMPSIPTSFASASSSEGSCRGLERLERHLHVGDLAAQLLDPVILARTARRSRPSRRAACPASGLEVSLRDRARRDLHGDALGLAALERRAVDRPLVVDHGPVALLRLEPALDRDELRHGLLEPRELVRDHLIRDLRRLPGDLEAAVVLRLDAGLHLDARGVADRLAVGDALGHRDVRRRDERDRLDLHRLGERLLDDLLERPRPRSRRGTGARAPCAAPCRGGSPRSFTRRPSPTYARSSSWATRSGSTSMVTFLSTGETFSTWIFMSFRALLRIGGKAGSAMCGRRSVVKREMGGEGLEPSRLAAPDPKSGASASSATRPLAQTFTTPAADDGPGL